MPRGVYGNLTIIDGWPMHFKKKNAAHTESLYHCVHRGRKVGCPASVSLDSFGRVRVIRSHERHEKDTIETEAELARQTLKTISSSKSDRARSLVNKIKADFRPESVCKMGDYNSMRRIIDSVRRRENVDKKSVNEGNGISGQYSLTNSGEQFVLTEKEVNGKSMIVFASMKCISILSESKVIYCDGTFDVTPDGYTQLFTIHGYVSERVVRPLVFCLLGSKEECMYSQVIQELIALPQLFNWNPSVVVCDFEVAIRNAFMRNFPLIDIHGCYFHLIKNWRKKAEDLGIYANMLDGGNLNEYWRHLKALPFLDDQLIPDYFLLIESTFPPHLLDEEFSLYLRKNYISGTQRNAPAYPPNTWSCESVTLNGIHRTTNVVEVWHRLLSPVVTSTNGFRKVQLTDLIDMLKTEEEVTRLDYSLLMVNPNYKVSKSRKLTNVLKDIRLEKVLKNNPTPPDKPLDGIELLTAISLALKP